jgi:hypothetical protein
MGKRSRVEARVFKFFFDPSKSWGRDLFYVVWDPLLIRWFAWEWVGTGLVFVEAL